MSTPSSDIPSGTSDTNNEGPSISRTHVESASDFSWERTILISLWMIYIMLLVVLAVIGCQKLLRRNNNNNNICTKWHGKFLGYVSYASLFFAISLSVATNTSCQFIYTSDDYLDYNLEAMGIWKVLRNNGNGNDECYPYSLFLPPVEGPALTASRTFGVMAPLFGGAVVFYYLLANTFEYPQKFIPISLFATAVIQALTLVLFRSPICDELSCTVAEGSLASLTAMFYWIMAGCCIYGKQRCHTTTKPTGTTVDQENQPVEP